MFIVFEGLDRVGKSTQLTKLAERLKYENHVVHVFKEPGTTEVGEIIRNEIIKKSNLKLSPITQTLLFGAARAELSAMLFRTFTLDELYGSDTIILIDRWKASTYAYQGAKLWHRNSYVHNNMLSFINRTNEIASFEIKPTLSLFFRLDLETIKIRLQSESEKDIFSGEKDLFYQRVADMYNRYIFENDKNENFVFIDSNNKSIDFIHEEVYNVVMFTKNQLKKDIPNEPKKEE